MLEYVGYNDDHPPPPFLYNCFNSVSLCIGINSYFLYNKLKMLFFDKLYIHVCNTQNIKFCT